MFPSKTCHIYNPNRFKWESNAFSLLSWKNINFSRSGSGIQIWKKKFKVMKVSFYVSLHNCLCRTDTPLPISHSSPNNIRNTGQILLPWITLIILTHVKWWWSESRSAIVWLFATSWTIQSMEFSRPAYWSG